MYGASPQYIGLKSACQAGGALRKRADCPYGSFPCGRSEELYDPSGQLLGHLNGANGVWWEEYVHFDGRLLWYYTQATNVSRYFHVNALGSLGLATDQTGASVEEMLYYPFGVRWQNSTGFGWDEKFAQFPQRDDDIQMYEARHREYNPGLGRWLTPDPAGMAAADPTNPQSWNRYAYVLNNPTTFTDPLGLSGGNPADPCSDPSYYDSHAECGGPPPCTSGVYDPACAGYPGCVAYGTEGCIPYPPGYPSGGYGGGGSGYGGGGGGGAVFSAPPAGQPPLAGGGPGYWSLGCPFPYNSMGLCGLSPSYWTGEAGLELSYTLWGIHGSFFAGLAIDSHGHVALYHGGGLGAGAGAGGSLSLQVGQSNGYDVCGLGGPFQNASGMGGLDGAEGTIDVFQGKGNGPGGIVTGGSLSGGIGGGGSASVAVTGTKVVPINGHCGPGGIWRP